MRKSGWIWSLVTLAACSCTSSPRMVDVEGPARRDPSVRGQAPDTADVFAANDAESDEAEGTAVLRAPVANAMLTPAGHRRRSHGGPQFTPSERRGPIDCPTADGGCLPGAPCGPRSGFVPGMTAGPYGPPVAAGPWMASHGAAPPVSLPRLYPDEYVCDGGDHGLPVHYDDYSRLGLETEDTVAEYVDSDGVFQMKPTTRVCIYAPRFGAMRTVSGPNSDTGVNRLASAHETQFGVGVRNLDALNLHQQRIGVDRMRVRSRLSGLESERRGASAYQDTSVAAHTVLINTFEDLAFVQSGQFRSGEEARLAAGMQAAIAWNRDENPIIAATTIQLQDVIAKFRPMEIVGREDKRTKGQLRIVKMADKKTAVPGDIVTFTIRYDNLGDLPVSQVRIADNLSPRLEYIEDSATSDRNGEVTTEDNGEGSAVVTIVLDDPLPGKSGGVITFQTKVR